MAASTISSARPLLSPEICALYIPRLVGCRANQLIAPTGRLPPRLSVSWCSASSSISRSVHWPGSWYWPLANSGLRRKASNDRLAPQSASSALLTSTRPGALFM